MLYNTLIPENNIQRLKKRNILNDNERVLFFYDNTTFLSAKKGLLCTDNTLIRFDTKKIERFDLSNIASLVFKEVDKATYTYKILVEFKNSEVVDITPKGAPNDEMKLIVDIFNKNILPTIK